MPAYKLTVMIEVEDAGRLHDAASARHRQANGYSMEVEADILAMYGPRERPDIGACLLWMNYNATVSGGQVISAHCVPESPLDPYVDSVIAISDTLAPVTSLGRAALGRLQGANAPWVSLRGEHPMFDELVQQLPDPLPAIMDRAREAGIYWLRFTNYGYPGNPALTASADAEDGKNIVPLTGGPRPRPVLHPATRLAAVKRLFGTLAVLPDTLLRISRHALLAGRAIEDLAVSAISDDFTVDTVAAVYDLHVASLSVGHAFMAMSAQDGPLEDGVVAPALAVAIHEFIGKFYQHHDVLVSEPAGLDAETSVIAEAIDGLRAEMAKLAN